MTQVTLLITIAQVTLLIKIAQVTLHSEITITQIALLYGISIA
jgi:hypothetical protein